MSHIADVQMQIRDLDALRSVVEAMGGTLSLNQKTYAWYGKFLNDWTSERAAVNRMDQESFGKCEHAITFPNFAYEIGVISHERETHHHGGYQLIYDSWGVNGTALEEKCGVGLTKIKQAYGVEVTRRQLSRQGYRVTTIHNANGTISVKAVRS